MSAFGEGDPDRYDPYAGHAGGFEHNASRGGGFQNDGFPGGAFDGGVEEHVPRHRTGSRMLVAAVIGTIALIVVGAVAFAGSLVMSRTSSHAPKSHVADAASAEPGDQFGGASVGPSAGGSSDPAEHATASPAPSPSPTPTTRATSPSPTKQTTPPAKPKSTTATAPAGNSAYEAQVLAIVNVERAKAGCQPLADNAKLRAAAYKHSADMATRNYFSHDTPEGVSFATRITNEGYRWSNAAENIAKGQRTPEDVMNAWMNSPGHRANILNCKLKDLGVGLAYQGKSPIWTQDFGTQM
ncbi:CAP domain-containing protein [Dactylosporangium sp. NPDC000555]|uniref:CAP domain-containing protein n=1 Tax=Dactylosporangium sp. NPDC000555 TaxID=3154260 RepID=UPI003332D043